MSDWQTRLPPKPPYDPAGSSDEAVAAHEAKANPHTGYLRSVVAGANVTVDNTDPQNPVVAATGGGGAGTAGPWTVAKKQADETRSSTTVYTDDADLQFAVEAGKTYLVRARIFYNSAGEALKHRPQASAAVSAIYSHLRQGNPGAAYGTDNEFTGAQAGFWFAITATGVGRGFIEFDAVFHADADGVFAWQWAQNVSAATNLTVLAGSYLEYAELGAASGGGYLEGDVFPLSPVDGQKFYRNDRNLLCYYDAGIGEWLTVHVEALALDFNDIDGPVSSNQRTSTIAARDDMYLLDVTFAARVAGGTNNGTNYWTTSVFKSTATDVSTLVATANTSAVAAGTGMRTTVAINAAIGAGFHHLNLWVPKTGAPSALQYATATVRYRLIVT